MAPCPLDVGGTEQEPGDDGCDKNGTDTHAADLQRWCEGWMPSVLPAGGRAGRAVSLVRGRALHDLTAHVCEAGGGGTFHNGSGRWKRSQGRFCAGRIAVAMGGRQDNFLGPTCPKEPWMDTVA
ncbi:hypothetical protein GCM10010207_67010 [Streptomyces atratus]|nr:hypothetical protein GCM10010207_67010 [Streptomyces atratus]